MPATQAPSVRRQRLGVALRRLRDRSGLSAESAGRRLGWSASKVSRLETARIGARVADVRRLLKLYQADERLTQDLLTLAAEATQRGWWDDYPEIEQSDLSAFIALEDDAGMVLQFETMIVPGLLQTDEYARHLIEGWNQVVPLTPTTIARRLEVRMRRQRLLQTPRNLPLSAVIDEAVLLRRIGQASTMAGQLEKLAELAELPHIDVRILPLDGEHGAAVNSFTLLEFPPVHDIPLPTVLHTESVRSLHTDDEALTDQYHRTHAWLLKQSISPEGSIARIKSTARRWRKEAELPLDP
jgi:transcriptional regulator with XRE-family HTH domain